MPVAPELVVDAHLASAGASASDHDFDRFHDIARRHALRTGIRFIDLRPAVRAFHATGEPVSFITDPHYNASANRVIADALVAALLGPPGPPSAAN